MILLVIGSALLLAAVGFGAYAAFVLDEEELAIIGLLVAVVGVMLGIGGIDAISQERLQEKFAKEYDFKMVDSGDWPEKFIVRQAGTLLECTLTANEKFVVCEGEVLTKD